jgi:hypothetical protein
MHTRTRGGALTIAAVFALLLAGRGVASAQEGGASSGQQQAAARAETNFEVQIHMLITAESVDDASKVPRALDGVVRQLKWMLPPADYKLAATFVNRVKDDGGFEVKSAGASPFGGPEPNPLTPSIFQLSLAVKSLDDTSGGRYVRVQPFKLGLKIPIQTASAYLEKGQGYPVIQYEDTGINTQMSVREGVPTLVGTLNTSRPGQLFVIVITVRRVGR